MAIKSDAQRRAVAKYKANNYDQIQLRVAKGEKDIYKAHAEARGESLNGFIARAMQEAMENDKSC